MPLQETSGAASYDAFGGGAAAVPNYIEDVFSPFLYTGTGSAQTITNGIDLSGEGGLVWTKSRSNAIGHALVDTANGVGTYLRSDSTAALRTDSSAQEGVTSFNADGYSLGNWVNEDRFNRTSWTYASWTFRKQAKFFDVVTYTGTGSTQNIAHNLGSVPGCIIVKRVTSDGNWQVYHRSTGNNRSLYLNDTGTGITGAGIWNNTDPTSTAFTVGSFSEVNQSGQTFVAYIFAHNAGGFGLSGSDNVISCGSYTGNGNTDGPDINLGFEAQWVMIKRTDASGNDWVMMDIMRGMPMDSGGAYLRANLSNNEAATAYMQPTPTGLKVRGSGSTQANASGATYIYIAIRRGPMKVPESGTSVFDVGTNQEVPSATSGFYSGFPVDMAIKRIITASQPNYLFDRLRKGQSLVTNNTSAESAFGAAEFDHQNGWYYDSDSANTNDYSWMFRRAPSFFDVVCYTGTGVARTVAHNLGVAPEFIQVKCRSHANGWMGYSALTGNTKYINFADIDSAQVSSTSWNNTSPTSSVFTVGTDNSVNGSARTYVAYLFATVAGVSKVGSYTGTGATQVINCGFTAGSRFVMIKRTDSTGSWYVWDSARGIVAGNDPYILLNSTVAQVTGTDYIDPESTGFEISSTAPGGINASGGSFIFLAIA